MSEYKNYIKQTLQSMRPYIPGEDLMSQGVSVWEGDIPELGGMIAVAKNPNDKWYVSKQFFEENVKDTFEDELADSIIRLLDLSAMLDIDIEFHITQKMRYNKTRGYKTISAFLLRIWVSISRSNMPRLRWAAPFAWPFTNS